MPDPFRNYDAWLEAPIQAAYAAGDALVEWCERNDVDPDSDTAETLYEEAMEADLEDAAERRAQQRADYEEDRMMERGEW